MTAFAEYRLCPYEGESLPVDHVCVAGASRHAGRGAATRTENEVSTDLTDVEHAFDAAPDWASTTDTTMKAFVDHHEHLTVPSPLSRRRVRRVLHRAVRFVGLVPARHGCRHHAVQVAVDPDATVDFHVVAPAWAERRNPYQGVA